MIDTSSRLLRLLSVLQTRRYWTGPELAERLEVTTRTLRRDVDRLRSLGYAIEGASGPGGGYHIGQGAAVPPLLLDDDEAVAVAVALRSAADSFAGVGEQAVSVLMKLEQLLPARLRNRLGALQAVTLSVVDGQRPVLDPALITTLAAACRDHEALRFAYRDRQGRESEREVEPLRLAHTGFRHWYLVAWDRDREDWRSFRTDRFAGAPRPGARFIPRDPPADLERFVREAVSYAPEGLVGRFRLKGSHAALAKDVPPWCGTLEALDEAHCLLHSRAPSPEVLLFQVLATGVDFEVLEPSSLLPHLRQLTERLQRCLPADAG